MQIIMTHLVWIVFFIITSPCSGNDLESQLSLEEKSWIKEHHTVRIRIGNAPPFMMTDGELRGISIDYLTHIFNINDIKIQYISDTDVTWPEALEYIKRHEVVDMVPTAKITEERKKDMIFTDEYIFAPWVIFTRVDSDFIASIDDLSGKTVSVEEGYVMHQKLKQEYSGIKLKIISANLEDYAEIPVKDLSTGLVDAYIGNLLSTTYMIQTKGYTNIKVAAPTPFDNHNQAMAIRSDWPELAGIINKTLAAMTPDEHAAIRNRWLSIRYEYGINKAYVLKWVLGIAGVASFFIGFVLFWNKRLKSEVASRKEIEKALLENKVSLLKAQKMAHFGNWAWDIKDDRITWSDEVYHIYGINPDTPLSYVAITEAIHPEDREYCNEYIMNCLKNRKTDPFEYRIIHTDASIRYLAGTAEIICDEEGEPKKLIGTLQDITERKLSEEALWNSTERFRKTFDSHLDAIFVLDTKTPANVLECNQAAIHIFGYTSDELIGNSIAKLHVDDSHMKLFRDQLYASIKKDGCLKNFEFSMKRKNGIIFPSEHTVLEMENDSGNRIGWISIVRDLTEIQKTKSALVDSEHKFKILFENAPLSYQSLDENGNFLEVNQTWLNVLGYKKEEVLGKNFGDFLHPDWQDHFKTNFPRFKAIGEILGVEFEILKKDGAYILVSFHGKIGHQPDGAFKQTHCVFRDITEQKRVEDEKNALTSQLQHSQKMEAIGTLAGGIAHDFNNVLSPIIGFAEILKEDLPEDGQEQKNSIEILRAALRAKDLVKQILAFSRKSDQELKPIKLQSILKEALVLLKASIPKTIDIQTDIDSDCGMVVSDSTQLHQIIMNLATNAYHAMQGSGGQLKLSLKQVEIESRFSSFSDFLPGKYALLKVIDTGTGIKKDIIEKIFDPYFTTKTTGKGTGLGLSVVRGIVKSCHGDIRVFSEQGKGTEVHVYLPIMKKETRNLSPDLSEPILGGTERILLVDDEEMVITMEKQMLERLGYEVTAWSGSIEAFNAFKEKPHLFDLIISDMTMPNMTGVQLANKIKIIRPDIPVIICTGFSDQINEETSKKLGIQGYVMKPVIKREIAKTIREVLKESQDTHIGNSSI